MTIKFPPLIALCGNPKSGKSEVQRILEKHGVVPVDDGLPLRTFGMRWFGLTKDQVFTQAGKLETIQIDGKDWEVRKILGELGNALEAKFGPNVMPFMACNNLTEGLSYSFGSVRRRQGAYYQERGGIVLEITRPGVEPSGNEFDTYDTSIVDCVIENDGTLEQLEKRVLEAVSFAMWKRTTNKRSPVAFPARAA